ncbi:MAG: coproporphyrinogen III oxidase [Myxococcota bacterium]|jgi:coproporphyrinogen III oxidase
MSTPDPAAVHDYLSALQGEICAALAAFDGQASFRADPRDYPRGGISRPMVLEGGAHIEKAAVNFTHSRGDALPPAATKRRPDLAGKPFEAVSMSLIVHPKNPYAPTSHANLRFFVAGDVWWFGGGFDLTPYYGFDEDCVHWHQTAAAACAPAGPEVYAKLKTECDRYFYLPHRDEPRGIGGLFFEDWSEGGGTASFDFVRSIGDHFLPAYMPILTRRAEMPYGERQRAFQLLRRGRYVEFNLVFDRGTLYGLQSGRRIEAVLASMPPQVRWEYGHEPEAGSDEQRLYTRYLQPHDWAAGAP